MDSSANPRASRWSDAPPGQASVATQDGNPNSTDKRPAPGGPEPPSKKVKADSGQVQGDGSIPGYVDGSVAGYGDGSGYGEGPSGLSQSRSTVGGHGYGASSGDQSYGEGYGAVQQNFTYGNNMQGGGQSYGSFAPGSAKGSGTGALFYKTKLCTNFRLGSCTFNERCNFAHGLEDLRKPPPGWEEMVKQGGGTFNMGGAGRSTEPQRRSNKPCRYYVDGNCPYGDRCTFSHGNEDAQRGAAPVVESSPGSVFANAPARPSYKTRLCTRWEKGEPCNYGDKCHFAHGQAELQAFSGGSSYNTTTMSAPTVYSDPSMMNPPPLAAPYGAPANYASTGGPLPVASPSLNPYSMAGANMNSYGTAQDGTNGYSTNYNYWNPENKWDGTNPAAPIPATIPTQGYVQANQTAPWMANYSVNSGYAKNDTSAAHYMQGQSLQQQSVPYYGTTPSYQDVNQNVNPYVQDGSQSNHPSEVKNGDGGGYYSASYPNQQAGYTSSYNTA